MCSSDLYEDEDFSEEEPPRRSPWPAVVVLALLVALLGGLLWGGYAWSQRQYYVGTDGTRVVLYQGLAQDLGPVSLSEPLEVTDIEIEDLPEITRQQVESTISVSDREGADQIIDRLEQAAAANRPPTAVSPSDGGGASDVGGAEEGAADGMAPLPTAGSPDEGEAT